MNWKLEALPGDDFHQVARQAITTAIREEMMVEFDFNGVQCLVDSTTDPALLFRDYQNAFLMKWKTVGPDCPVDYDPSVQAELDRRTQEKTENDAQVMAKYEEECRIEKAKLEERTNGIELALIDPAAFESWKAKNTDPYSACIFEYAEGWAKLMQSEMTQGKSLTDCAEATSFELGYLGITGYMYGAAVNILAQCWKHGEELRAWHNGKYNHKGTGVVNPAVLTISTNS